MAEINLITTSHKYVDLADSNFTFLNRYFYRNAE